jgi:hypothetical protein
MTGRHLVAEPLRGHLRCEQRLDLGEHLVRRDAGQMDVQLAGLDPRQVQDVVDDREQVLLVPADAGQVFGLLLGHGTAEPHLHQVGVATDGVERRAQFVTHHREEGGLRLVRRLRSAERVLCHVAGVDGGVEQRGAVEGLRALLREADQEAARLSVEGLRAGEAQGDDANRAVPDYERERGPGAARRSTAAGALRVPRPPLLRATDVDRLPCACRIGDR